MWKHFHEIFINSLCDKIFNIYKLKKLSWLEWHFTIIHLIGYKTHVNYINNFIIILLYYATTLLKYKSQLFFILKKIQTKFYEFIFWNFRVHKLFLLVTKTSHWNTYNHSFKFGFKSWNENFRFSNPDQIKQANRFNLTRSSKWSRLAH